MPNFKAATKKFFFSFKQKLKLERRKERKLWNCPIPFITSENNAYIIIINKRRN